MTCSTAGLGLMPLGTSPLAFYEPTEATARPDPSERFSRYIDTATRDYGQDPVTRQLKQMPPIRQRVLYALGQEKGSAIFLPDDGVDYPDKIDDRFDAKVDRTVRLSLDRMVRVEKVIRIDSIQVEVSGSRARPIVEYTDLTTGERDTVAR